MISKNVCLSACTAIDSAPGSDTVLGPISLESVWPEDVQREKKFSEKWPLAKLQKKNVRPLQNAFQWENMFMLAIKDSD
jgi:hypothetical protein